MKKTVTALVLIVGVAGGAFALMPKEQTPQDALKRAKMCEQLEERYHAQRHHKLSMKIFNAKLDYFQ